MILVIYFIPRWVSYPVLHLQIKTVESELLLCISFVIQLDLGLFIRLCIICSHSFNSDNICLWLILSYTHSLLLSSASYCQHQSPRLVQYYPPSVCNMIMQHDLTVDKHRGCVLVLMSVMCVYAFLYLYICMCLYVCLSLCMYV